MKTLHPPRRAVPARFRLHHAAARQRHLRQQGRPASRSIRTAALKSSSNPAPASKPWHTDTFADWFNIATIIPARDQAPTSSRSLHCAGVATTGVISGHAAPISELARDLDAAGARTSVDERREWFGKRLPASVSSLPAPDYQDKAGIARCRTEPGPESNALRILAASIGVRSGSRVSTSAIEWGALMERGKFAGRGSDSN